MTKKSLYERLTTINRELDLLLGKTPSLKGIKNDNMNILLKYGLSYDDAKAWLEHEPNYIPIRQIFTEDESDKDLTESFKGSSTFSLGYERT